MFFIFLKFHQKSLSISLQIFEKTFVELIFEINGGAFLVISDSYLQLRSICRHFKCFRFFHVYAIGLSYGNMLLILKKKETDEKKNEEKELKDGKPLSKQNRRGFLAISSTFFSFVCMRVDQLSLRFFNLPRLQQAQLKKF